MEHESLLTPNRLRSVSSHFRTRRFAKYAAAAFCVIVLLVVLGRPSRTAPKQLPRCTQTEPLVPTGPSDWIDQFTFNQTFIEAAAERLAGAVRIRTESFDFSRGVQPPLTGPDTVHAGFEELHSYVAAAFPRVHAALSRKIVNRYAMLYTWKGRDSARVPPLVLMSHQDTVPVLNDTLAQWTHAPFSGRVNMAEDSLWGRGSVDTKATLVGALEAVDALLARGYVPRADVFLVFGFDEEISGLEGARFIAEYMEHDLALAGRVGLVVDEGLDSFSLSPDGPNLAIVNTAEKGYLDYHISVETPGGHSSLPPDHTGIGHMADLVHALESNPHPIMLTESNPYLGTIVCTTEHSKNPDPVIQKHLQRFDQSSATSLASYLANRSLKDKYRMASSQSIDIIRGGLKINALPEIVTVDINNRISIDSSASEFQEHILQSLLPVAIKKHLNFTFIDFLKPGVVLGSHNAGAAAVGSVKVFSSPEREYPLEPSPISIVRNAAWNILEGTIHHVYERDVVGGTKYVVAPGLMAGNTDTRYFWNLSRNIMRFSPATGGAGYHTVDEHASIRGYMLAVTFFHELIRNYDEHGEFVKPSG